MLKLSEQEKQDIIRHLENNKELPEKYRFLLFEDKREVELVWNGKSNEVCNIVLPFQTIEQMDEPRAEKPEEQPLIGDLFSTDARGRQLKGWTNKLIWGDNKLILSSLKNGPMREAIEKQGGLKLIYIDPPFDVGADFSMDIEIGGDTFTKKPNILEEIAYRDTWGKGTDSFVSMIYERLALMHDLLADDGSIYVHCDWRVSSFVRLVLDEIFGRENFRNEIIWHYGQRTEPRKRNFDKKHDNVLFYGKRNAEIFQSTVLWSREEFIAHRHDVMQDEDGREFIWTDGGKGNSRYKRYVDEVIKRGKPLDSVWEIQILNSSARERVGYPTQKPESFLERIVKASSQEGDLIADFFCGSGTTAAVAEKLNRKWICTDLGKFAIHTTRKRMIGVQRQLKKDGKDYRAFEILNLGKYEREHFVGVNPDLREEQQRQQLAEKEAAFLALILRAYQAEKVEHFENFHGKRGGRLIAVGPVNLPVTRLFVEEIILECRKKHITKVDILGFEFEMGLFPNVLDEARGKGIDIAPKYIPAEVFDKRAVERNQVVFHDVAFIEVKPIVEYPEKRGKRVSKQDLTPHPPLSGGLADEFPPDKGGKGGYLPYNSSLTEKARENRKNPTPAENKLWYEVLRGKSLSDLKFTRQKPLDEFIVDFYCAELMLAIEVDGDSHTEQQEYDALRTQRLNKMGVEVVRYTNREVLENIDGVYSDLEHKISERRDRLTPSLSKTTPQPPLSGGLNISPPDKGGKGGYFPTVAVELTDFSVFYSQDSTSQAEEALSKKKTGSKIVVEHGQIVKLSKDKSGAIKREVLTQHWTDWIDYWAVDFDFENKREIIRVQNPESGETEEQWTGEYIFENEWQSFRTKKDRSLELKSVAMECRPGRYKIAVKVVDIFGNDTMSIVEVNV